MWIKALLPYVPALALFLTVLHQCNVISQHEQQQTPEITVQPRYNVRSGNRAFVVINSGLVDCKTVWATERVYVAIEDVVYSGVDVPHLAHYLYKGSRTSIGELIQGDSLKLDPAEHQAEALLEIHERMGGTSISRWRLECTREARSKTYVSEQAFVFDSTDWRFRAPAEVVGAGAISDAVDDYVRHGSRREIGIDAVSGMFSIDPPKEFLVGENDELIPLYPGRVVPLEVFQNAHGMRSTIQINIA